MDAKWFIQVMLIRNLMIYRSSMLKRFQYYSREGVKWTDWFEWHSTICPKYQLERHPKLLNEYKDESEDIPKSVLEGC